MEYRHIMYQPGKVARIVLDRPRFLNAQSYLMLEEMDAAFRAAMDDPACGAVALSGAGRAFSVGHDIGTEEDIVYRVEHGYGIPGDGDPHRWFEDMRKLYVEFGLAWRNLPKPTVAIVHGYCIFGGWMVAAAMDVIFAAEDTRFLPGFVEYFSLPWEVGPRRAKEILLEHRFLTAQEAYRYGFVNRVYPPEEVEAEALAYADRTADNYLADPAWVRLSKRAINHMEDAMGFSAEMSAAFNDFCLMVGTRTALSAPPEEGGFARTTVAKRNFALSQPWLRKAGLE